MFPCKIKDLTAEAQENYIDIDEAASRAPAGQDSEDEDADSDNDSLPVEPLALMALPVGTDNPDEAFGLDSSMSRAEEIQHQIQNLKEEMASIPDHEVIEIHDTIPPSPVSKRVADIQARMAYWKNLHNQEAMAPSSEHEMATFPIKTIYICIYTYISLVTVLCFAYVFGPAVSPKLKTFDIFTT